jgi:hypothetical protein
MLKSMQLETSLNFQIMLALSEKLARRLDSEAMHSNIWHAGLPKTLGSTQIHENHSHGTDPST